MISTTGIHELFKIVNVEHGEPHNVLGMHEVVVNEKMVVAVRTFIPDAERVSVVDDSDESLVYEMKKIHGDGFFESVIETRNHWFMYRLKVTNKDGKIWESYDPYSFQPTISEYDRYLFNSGTHYNIYEKLGSHICNINGVDGVSFGVWAPNAKAVSVIGDFNQWDGRRNPMRRLGPSGIWEIFIPGLMQYDKYKFYIKSKDNNVILKSDPYSNFNELRPNNASIVFDINKYIWNDSKWIDNRRKFISGPINIYEVHLGSWKRVVEEGNRPLSYVELADSLVSYVKDMGYNYIEILPVTEHPFDGSWGYQVTGYYAPTSRLGNPLEFKYFVDKCHQSGIGVIMDWVPAHFPKDEHGLAKFDGTALYEHDDPRQGEHPEWGTLIYNYGRKEVKNFLIANALFWIKEFHIDGLRVDAVASMLYLDYGKKDGEWIPNEYGGNKNIHAVEFLKHLNSIVSKEYPFVMMIAEESTSWEGVTKPVDEDGLGFTLKWNMGWMNDFLKYIKTDPLYRKYEHDKLTFSMMYAYSEKFVLVLSHDEVVHGKSPMIGKMPGDLWQKFANYRVAMGMMYGHPGKKLIFMGGEFAQFSEWSEARALDWSLLQFNDHINIKNYFRDLNNLYIKEPALWEKDYDPEGFKWINCDDSEKSIVSFVRRSSYDTLIFICNFTPNTYNYFKLGVPIQGVYKEIFNSDDTKYGGSNVINCDDILTNKMECDGFENSLLIKVPPLAVSVLKWYGKK